MVSAKKYKNAGPRTEKHMRTSIVEKRAETSVNESSFITVEDRVDFDNIYKNESEDEAESDPPAPPVAPVRSDTSHS